MKLSKYEPTSSNMPLDSEVNDSNDASIPRWKNRLQRFKNSLRASLRPKKRKTSKDLIQDVEDGQKESRKSSGKDRKNWTSLPSVSTRDAKDNKVMFWRENGVEQKHTRLSKKNKKQGSDKPKSTSKLHSMHKKTLSDSQDLNERNHDEWRKYYSHNNISELQTRLPQEEKNHNVSYDVIKELSSTESSPNLKRRWRKKNNQTSLSRPKSLNILTSLFKRSSTSKNELKTNRGNLTKTETLHSTKAKSSTSVPTECDFERKCDPTLSSSSSIESLDDDDFYPIEGTRNIKRHNSLKRSRASLIFPRNSICCQDRGNLREKARTFCGVQDFLALESSPNITEGSDFDSQTAISERRRESCLVKEKKRSVSLVVPLSSSTVDFVHYHLTDNRASLKDFKSFIKTDSSHLRYQRASINNIRSISKRMSMSAQSFANIPSLGVTYVNNDGVENTLVILSGNASQSCYNLFKENERIHFPLKVNYCQGTAEEKVTMGNQQGSRLERSSSFGDFLEQGGTLKATSSTPDLYRAAFSGYTLTRAEEVSKKNMSHMMKGWSLKRHTLTINPKNHDPPNKGKKHRKLFGLGSHHQSKDKKGWTNESNISEAKCKSLSRSVDCLSEKPLPIRRDYKGLFRPPTSSKTATKMEQRAKNCSINCESDYEDASQVSKDSGHDSTTSRPLPMPRGSQLKALDSEDFSAPASFENGSVFLRNYRRYSMGVDGSNPQDSPLIPRMSTLERERSKSALTYPNDPQFPPAVRPRIQSLEELSPVEAEVILRKKKSFASRKTRAKHSLSMPTEELLASVDLSDDVKRYSFGEEMSNFSDAAPVPLTAYKSFSTEFLTSQESLDTINSSSEMGSTTSITSEKLLSPPIFLSPFKASLEDISKSPTIEEEPSSGLLEPDAEKKKTSLSRNPRLGRSTGDLSFELSSTLRRQRDEESMFEEMDVPEAFAEALWDHVTMDPEELSFKAGDIITVISMTNVDWWFGQVGEMVGWFPAPFVRVRVSQELDEIEHQQAQPVRTRKFTNEGLLTKEVVRARVVNELLETEKAYVKNIKDVVEGYLKQAQKRDDMFSEEELYTLFSNIEEIYAFHKKLLAQMKNCYVKDDPCASQIGAVFLANKQGFSIYSEYCNNHPQAIAEFKTLNESNKYKHFFEACRLLQGMINISLDGFLLTPVQKICKYPLQLAELLKHTHPSHPDFEPVSQALKTMKDVAGLINERKRKVESINKIARWQGTIEGWEGDNVLERSSELFCSGEVYKVSNGTTQERICFLFDHQLIYCKKDILRKNALTYKGRIDMDLAIVEWLEDGQETHKNEPLNNAWKIYNSTDYKWYVVYTKKPEQKEKWKLAFEKERTKVNEKVESGLEISQSTRRAVMRSASSSIKGKKSAAERREKYLRSVSQTDALKSPPSPTLRLPPPVSSEDFIKEDGDTKESVVGFLQRTSALRRSFGLRGSKRSHKDKRTSSVF
ncbi:uncharacterized protein LOC116303475 [Actinia tenebrosa]|uniref:Uncharacterized protein LOC116303475 n=1 Tax=Actinia tenebrosa TaxID=6105 RepID=A0A6P8IR48_ACTTE|nr:uncharacterized protein LOC116303475 [Actinia tenebrosa]XP_031568881.1 uncharacterized protein LOC116303475 [Actinia tenebrosa]